MHPRLLCIIGGLLLGLGILGFLFASIGLSSADKVPEITAPKGMEIVRRPDDPQVKQRKLQAERVLFASLLIGGVGIVSLALGILGGRRQRALTSAA